MSSWRSSVRIYCCYVHITCLSRHAETKIIKKIRNPGIDDPRGSTIPGSTPSGQTREESGPGTHAAAMASIPGSTPSRVGHRARALRVNHDHEIGSPSDRGLPLSGPELRRWRHDRASFAHGRVPRGARSPAPPSRRLQSRHERVLLAHAG